MRLNILFGGEAGQGPNILTHILGEALVKQGYYVFYSRDYQSLIRGGHNFNVLTFSDEPVHSNESKIDIIVALDENTEKIHNKNLKKNGYIIKGKHPNMYFAGKLFKILGLNFKILEKELKELKERFNENIKEAREGYKDAEKSIEIPKVSVKKAVFVNGNQGISIGAVKSGLDIYYGYPMTPATPILGELAKDQIKNNLLVLELENEIACINAAIGSAITGAKAMVGTSGGGFDLMTEALSLTGMAEVALVIYLAQRPGPATGVATYTGQGDLNIARHSGHGEFPRLVLSPGDPNEAQELTSQAFYFSQKFKIPVIIIGDKHLAESFYTLIEKPEIIKSQKLTKLARYNSYEKDKYGSATDKVEIIKKNIEARRQKALNIEKESKKFKQYKIYGNKKSKNVIVGWGSTKGVILDAIKDLNCKFLQILYIEPFPRKIKEELERKNIILIENNSTGQLANLIAEKTGIFIQDKNKILRYDGRPFLYDELKEEIQRRLK
ncbi:2-oxoglutarate oxidoreductase subunit KorA [subsurface metagenome]